MILPALDALYTRLAPDPAYDLPQPGYSTQRISFCVVLKTDGSLFAINDARDTSGKKPVSSPKLVPGNAKPSGSGLNPCFLWDNSAYLLGYKADDKKPARTEEAFAEFRNKHLSLEAEIADLSFSTVCRFLKSWTPEQAAEHRAKLDDFAATGFGVFQLQGEPGYVHERPAIRSWWERQQSAASTGELGQCLVSGEIAPLAQLHEPAIKGVAGAQSAGAKIVSFNCDAFVSYGKDQSYNAPVSAAAAFRYTNALNALLAGPQSSRHRIQIGDATCVFWTERPTATESLFSTLLGYTAPDELAETAQDEGLRSRLKILLEVLRQGGGRSIDRLGDDAQTRFYFLGLSPNAARLSVRFWHVDSLGSLVDNLKAHYDALRLDRPPGHAPEFPTARQLLGATAIVRHKGDREETDFDTIPPLLSGPLLRAILTGGDYPRGLYQAVLQRIRADQTISYFRTAVLKAFLNRNHNHALPMSLDPTRTDPGYLLGRLFAVLEKAQSDALPGLNATIKDRFYGAASANPATVFPRILRTAQHHLAKLEPSFRIIHEKRLQEIVGQITVFPRQLSLEAQGLFAIGYYHQKQNFYTKKTAESPAE